MAHTSFWKSTNAFTRRSARIGAARQARRSTQESVGDGVGSRAGAAKPAAVAAARPAASPSASAPARSKVALQAPADRSRCTDAPGLKTCSASSKASLPRDCEKRCTEGVQPPDIMSASQATFAFPPAMSTRTALTRRRPSTPRISAPAITSIAGGARGLRQRAHGLSAQIGDQLDGDARLLRSSAAR